MSSLAKQLLIPLAAIAAVIIAWDLGVHLTGVPDYLVPPPADVASIIWSDRVLLDTHARATLVVALVGLLGGIVLGACVAVAIGLSETLRRAVEPLLIASQAIPPVVFAPVLIVALGYGPAPKILVVMAGAFFPVVISASTAMRNADPYLVDFLRSTGASRLMIMRQVRFPSAVPALFAGAKVSSSYAVFSAVIAEWMGASKGLAIYLQRSQASYQMDQIYAAVVIIALCGVALFMFFTIIGNLATAWSRPSTSRKVS